MVNTARQGVNEATLFQVTVTARQLQRKINTTPTRASPAEKGKGSIPERLGTPDTGSDVIAATAAVAVLRHRVSLALEFAPLSKP